MEGGEQEEEEEREVPLWLQDGKRSKTQKFLTLVRFCEI